jgi:hypothetical protein
MAKEMNHALGLRKIEAIEEVIEEALLRSTTTKRRRF